MIKAKGILFNREINVEVNHCKAIYNGEKNALLDRHMESCIENAPAMGGTYYPTKNEMLCYYNVLTNNFFDKLISIEADGLEEMPNEEGVVY